MERYGGRSCSIKLFGRYILLFGYGCPGDVHGARFCDARGGHGAKQKPSEILTKNVALFAIASVMYLLIGYAIMYGGGGAHRL